MDEVESLRTVEFLPDEPVGINALLQQLIAKRKQEGFVFNILLVGETGIGKSTLACSLFNTFHDVSGGTHQKSEVTLKTDVHDLCEKGVDLKLTIVETVGYGDQIDRSNSVNPIIQYIDTQFEKYFGEELKLKRSLSTYRDTRIHACLYFICPTGHSLKAIDVHCMKALHGKVNLIPVVAKADFLTKEELQRFKLAIRSAIERHGIKIYRFPTDDEETADFNTRGNELVPFAVASSNVEDLPIFEAASGDNAYHEVRSERARVLPWGTMMVENEQHTEFSALRQALIEVNLEDLREKTHNEFFQDYKTARMTQLGHTEAESVTYYEILKRQRERTEDKRRQEEESLKQRFLEKLKAKENELKVQEGAIRLKYQRMNEQLKKEEETIQRWKDKLELKLLQHKNVMEMKLN